MNEWATKESHTECVCHSCRLRLLIPYNQVAAKQNRKQKQQQQQSCINYSYNTESCLQPIIRYTRQEYLTHTHTWCTPSEVTQTCSRWGRVLGCCRAEEELEEDINAINAKYLRPSERFPNVFCKTKEQHRSKRKTNSYAGCF